MKEDTEARDDLADMLKLLRFINEINADENRQRRDGGKVDGHHAGDRGADVPLITPTA